MNEINEKTILTDEQVDAVIEAAESANNGNDDIEKMKDAKEMSIEEMIDGEQQHDKNVSIAINPSTGIPEGVTTPNSGYGYDKESDIFEDFDDLNPSTEVDKDFTDYQIEKSLISDDDKNEEITPKDINEVRQVLIKKNKEGTVKYSDLPKILKDRVDIVVRKALGRGIIDNRYKMARNMLANQVVEEINMQIVNEKISDVCIDLDTSIKNLVKNEYSDIYSQQHKQEINTFVYKFPELADTKYKDDPEKQKLLIAISDGYKQAHSLEKMYEAYCRGGKYMKIKDIDIEKLHKVIRDFEMKYENNNLTIRDINSAEEILVRHVNSRFSIKAIKGFIAVFCKYTRNMKPSNTDEHTFMYYFINNILSLDIPMTDKDDIEYREEFINNINHFLGAIDDRLNKK